MRSPRRMDEFDLIATHFAPLSRGYDGSLGLTDDAAIIAAPEGCELVITKDALSEGVHFLGSEDASLIARKALRSNLSDLAAMGAKPLAYFLALMLPAPPELRWIERFAVGLREDQEVFGVHLAGGDTIATRGTLSLSITALGTVPAGRTLRRNGAKAGDRIYVSGTLGDSALGLQLLLPPPVGGRAGVGASPLARNAEPAPTPTLPPTGGGSFLIHRYLLPEPRLALGQRLIGLASAAMDVSDGLMQDLGHLCRASRVGAIIKRQALPLSPEARSMLGNDATLWDCIHSGGDDYELLFTAPAAHSAQIKALAAELSLPLTEIGHIEAGSGVTLLDEKGETLPITHPGFRHF